jgi:hypothetical protein
MTAALYHRKLARVLDRMGGTHTLNDILTRIADGRMQSHVVNNSWAITQVVDFPRAKALEVFAAVGDLDDLRILHDKILDFADEINASVVRAYGRKGWLPDAAARGWKVKAKYYVYQKDM